MAYPPQAPSPRGRQYPMSHPVREESDNLLEEEAGRKGQDSTSVHMGPSPNANGSAREGAKAGPKEEEPASRGMVIFSVLFYLVAAIVMVMANKWVLNAVPVPLFFLFSQLAIAVILLHVSAFFGYFKIPKIELEVCKGIAPLVAINCLGLGLNTFTLQYVDASFYQVARGLVLPFTVILSYFLLGTRSSLVTYGAVVVVCIGFFAGVSAEHMTVSQIGVFFGVFSSLTTAVHAIVVKRSLGVVKGSTMDLVYYNNFLSSMVVFPTVIVSGEIAKVLSMWEAGGDPLWTFLSGTAIAGFFGFLICIAGFLSIKVTSPVTHMVSSAVRGVLQTFLGMWVFGDIITTGRAFGISFILAGSIWYTWIKDRESRQQTAAKESMPSHNAARSGSTSPIGANGSSAGVGSSFRRGSEGGARRTSAHVNKGSRGLNIMEAGAGVGEQKGNGHSAIDVVVDEKAAIRERDRVY